MDCPICRTKMIETDGLTYCPSCEHQIFGREYGKTVAVKPSKETKEAWKFWEDNPEWLMHEIESKFGLEHHQFLTEFKEFLSQKYGISLTL